MEDVYFSHKEGAGGALTHQGDNLTGEGDGVCVCSWLVSVYVYVRRSLACSLACLCVGCCDSLFVNGRAVDGADHAHTLLQATTR